MTYIYFCGNRTDNAIKNHWHSSVKKKLDSYLASGLLTELQSVPHAGNPCQSMVITSSRLQCNGDDNALRGSEGEEVLECSHESANALQCPSTKEMTNVEEYRPNEDCSLGKDHSPSQASCSEPSYVSIDDPTVCVPEIACHDANTSGFVEQQYSHEPGSSINGDCQFNLDLLPDISSMELGQESSQLQRDCTDPTEIGDLVNVPYQTSMGLGVSTSMEPTLTDSANPEHMLISDDECCKVLFPEANNDGSFYPGDYNEGEDRVAFSGHPAFGCQTCHNQIPDTGGTSTPQLTCPQCSNHFIGMSSSQSAPPVHSAIDSKLACTTKDNQLLWPEDQQLASRAPNNFSYANDISSYPCIDGRDNAEAQQSSDTLKDTSKLGTVNSFCYGSDAKKTCFPTDEKPNVLTEKEDTGALFYEPPRCLDGAFISCDLAQSGFDMQQEFSPLGIRQLMMSSMNCMTPLRLWDSPSRDDSPEALLKSAAKTFTGTPSILKKRRGDVLSPLSGKRIGKKLLTDMTSTFSSLEADILSPSSLRKKKYQASVYDDDKENCGQAYKGERVDGTVKSPTFYENYSQSDALDINSHCKAEQRHFDVDSEMKIDAISEIVSTMYCSCPLSVICNYFSLPSPFC